MPAMCCLPWRRWRFSASLPRPKKLWKLIGGSRKAKKEASEQKKDKDKKQHRFGRAGQSREEDSDKDEERLEEEAQKEERKCATQEDGETPLGRYHEEPWYTAE